MNKKKQQTEAKKGEQLKKTKEGRGRHGKTSKRQRDLFERQEVLVGMNGETLRETKTCPITCYYIDRAGAQGKRTNARNRRSICKKRSDNNSRK